MLQEYLMPESVAEVISFLEKNGRESRIIAGGTDLLLDISSGKIKASYLVDISSIQELKNITLEDGVITIGAAVTHNQVAKSKLILENAPALAKAARSVGSLQIRNTATVIGNVINAQPAADTAVALVTLGAVAEIVSPAGKNIIPVEEMYAGVGKSTVDSTSQLVTCVRFAAALKNQGSAFVRLAQRKALALPMLNVGVMVSLEEDKFQWARIVMAPVGPGPVRAITAEKLLLGAIVDGAVIKEAAQAAAAQANPRSSALRGSKEYRTAVLPALVRRALEIAVAQARA